jgi:hypothetical protein
MTKMPRNDAAIMPPNTGTLTSLRASIAAPVAITNGTSPRMKAKEVIITGRKRKRAPSVAASSSRLSACWQIHRGGYTAKGYHHRGRATGVPSFSGRVAG